MRQIKRDQAIVIDKCYVKATISFLLQVIYQETQYLATTVSGSPV